LSSSSPQRISQYEIKTVQPLPESGILEFGQWIMNEQWESLPTDKSPSEQVIDFERILSEKMDQIFPKKTIKLRQFDKPFFTAELKVLDRRKKREYLKKGKSEQYLKLSKKYEAKYRKAAQGYLDKNVRSLKESNPSKAYSTLKRMGNQPGDCSEDGSFTLLNHIDENLTPEQCTERIAQHFANISQEYPPLDINSLPQDVKNKFINPINPSDLPQITPVQVYEKIRKAKKPKSQVPGDLPKALVQEFSPELAGPMASIFQNIIQTCQWPSSWKTEYGTPLQKVKNPCSEDELRIISLTSFSSKIFEQFVMDWILEYVADKMDWGQFGGLKGSSISHYLIEFTNFILYNQDMKNPQAVLAMMVDFSKAFNRQNHNILVRVLSDLGVPAWLMRLVASFLTERELILRYKGCKSSRKSLPGGSPQGTRLGMFLFLILINFAGFDTSEVSTNLGQQITKPLLRRKPIGKKHLKYIDDLSYLTSIDLKAKLENDPDPSPARPLAFHNRTGHYLPNEHCEISKQLDKLNTYVRDHQMRINVGKTKVMLFNTARNWDFTPTVSIGNSENNIEVVEQIKLLGIIVTSDMKWHANTAYLCERGYSKLWLLRNLKRLGATTAELLDVYMKQCRSILELAAPVWTGGLKSDDIVSLERVQKTACAIILGRAYEGYENALLKLDIKSLEERRLDLCLKFVKKSAKDDKYKHWFVKADAATVKTRSQEFSKPYKPVHTRTDRYKDSPLPFLTNLLNSRM
jgi:hypothetical protein